MGLVFSRFISFHHVFHINISPKNINKKFLALLRDESFILGREKIFAKAVDKSLECSHISRIFLSVAAIRKNVLGEKFFFWEKAPKGKFEYSE